MKNYIEIVNRNVNIEEGISLIEQYLLTVYFESPISNKILARKLLIPIPLVTAIKKEFFKLGILQQKNGIAVTDKGMSYIENIFGLKSIDKQLYFNIYKRKIEIDDFFQNELNLLNEILKNRPIANRSLDQAHCTAKTSFMRSLLTIEYRCLLNKKILCLGDDDLVSVAIGLLLRRLYGDIKQNKTEIWVFDLDKRYLLYIESLAKKYSLSIKCHHMDFREPLEKSFNNYFDCFFTDPPYTLNGLELFLSRGISALKNIKGLPIFLSFAHKSYDESYEMLKKFYDMGLSLKQITSGFNEYEGASIIANIGQLDVLYTTSKTSETIKSNERFLDNLYTREVKYNLKSEKLNERI
jgi:predicted methyltransferase